MLGTLTTDRPVIVVHPELCSGCGKRLYTEVGQLKACETCCNTFSFGSQLWICRDCDRLRKWGDGLPDNRIPKRLNCEKCEAVTEHFFYELSTGLAQIGRH